MEASFRVTRTPVHEQVRDHLQDLIRSGELVAGDALPAERELAVQLGVSRHSLRQAIASLEAVGAVETRHGSGVYLTSRPSDEAVVRFADALFNVTRSVGDAIEARLAIEPYVARLAAERRTDEDLARLLRSIDLSEAEVGEGTAREALSFHQLLALMTGNPIFEGLLRSVTTGPRNITQLAKESPDSPTRWHAEHVAIGKAIAAGNGARAARLMTAHLESMVPTARTLDAKRRKT